MGPGLSDAEVGIVGQLDIQARDQFGNAKFDITDQFSGYMHHEEQDVTVPLTTWCVEADQLCYASYQVNSPGGHWKVYVFLAVTLRSGVVLDPQPILGSPFDLTMQEAPVDAAYCTVTGDGVNTFSVGKRWSPTSRDRFSNAVSYTAESAVEFDVMISGPLATCIGTADDAVSTPSCLMRCCNRKLIGYGMPGRLYVFGHNRANGGNGRPLMTLRTPVRADLVFAHQWLV